MPKAKDSPKKPPVLARCALRPGVAGEDQCDKAADSFAIRGMPLLLSLLVYGPAASCLSSRTLQLSCTHFTHLLPAIMDCSFGMWQSTLQCLWSAWHT